MQRKFLSLETTVEITRHQKGELNPHEIRTFNTTLREAIKSGYLNTDNGTMCVRAHLTNETAATIDLLASTLILHGGGREYVSVYDSTSERDAILEASEASTTTLDKDTY